MIGMKAEPCLRIDADVGLGHLIEQHEAGRGAVDHRELGPYGCVVLPERDVLPDVAAGIVDEDGHGTSACN